MTRLRSVESSGFASGAWAVKAEVRWGKLSHLPKAPAVLVDNLLRPAPFRFQTTTSLVKALSECPGSNEALLAGSPKDPRSSNASRPVPVRPSSAGDRPASQVDCLHLGSASAGRLGLVVVGWYEQRVSADLRFRWQQTRRCWITRLDLPPASTLPSARQEIPSPSAPTQEERQQPLG